MHRGAWFVATVAAGCALAVAGCGDDDSGSSSALGRVFSAPTTPEPDLSPVVGARKAVLTLPTKCSMGNGRKIRPALPVSALSRAVRLRANAAESAGDSPGAGLLSMSVWT